MAVKKHRIDGEKREKHKAVFDIRKLIDNTVDKKYRISWLEDILDRLGGTTVFSTLDLMTATHQISRNSGESYKTVFPYERNHFEFTQMPSGHVPEADRRVSTRTGRIGLPSIYGLSHIYLDLLCFSKKEKEHIDDLRSEKFILGHVLIKF